MIKGIIFDLDGVIVSTDQFHFMAWKKMADKEDIYFNQEINHQLRGVSRMDSLEIILKKSSKTYTADEKESLANFKNNYYVKSLEVLTTKDILPGVLEVLDYYKNKGIKLAIGSSSKNARLILDKIGLSNYFDIVIDGNDIINSKPHPEVFEKAGKALGLLPNQCAVVEDAQSGIKAAYDAKMTSVAIGDAVDSPLADYKINQLIDIIKLI